MRSALVWDITQPIVVNSLSTLRDNPSVASSRANKSQKDFMNLEDATDGLSRSVGKELTTMRCVVSQISAGLTSPVG